MKYTKRFFHNDNGLNRGFENNEDISGKSIEDSISKINKYVGMLPPVEMVEYYESVQPGTIKKILQIAEDEQKSLHKFNQLKIEQEVAEKNRMRTCIAAQNVLAIFFIVLGSVVIGSMSSGLIAVLFALATSCPFMFFSYRLTRVSNVRKEGGNVTARASTSKNIPNNTNNKASSNNRYNRKRTYKK